MLDMLWLSQGNVQSAGSILTNDTLADRGVIVHHHYGVSLLSIVSSSCGVAREKAFFVDVITNVQTWCASFQKIPPVLNIFCM